MKIIQANWPAPKNVYALSTTRIGGVSLAPYHSNNLGLNTNDELTHVMQNRQCLVESLSLKMQPQWLQQIHSNQTVIVENDKNRTADASISRTANIPLAILTADCLPIVLCNKAGNEVAAIHAGWKGLAQGVIENTLQKIHSKPEHLFAWIGPSICVNCYETGDEVFDTFDKLYPNSRSAFIHKKKWHTNLSLIAENILKEAGVTSISQSRLCTFEQEKDFFSYRRQAQTGRIATLIWFDDLT